MGLHIYFCITLINKFNYVELFLISKADCIRDIHCSSAAIFQYKTYEIHACTDLRKHFHLLHLYRTTQRSMMSSNVYFLYKYYMYQILTYEPMCRTNPCLQPQSLLTYRYPCISCEIDDVFLT